MTEEHYILLLQKRLTGEITPEEDKLLSDWISQNAENQKVAELVKSTWKMSGGFSEEVDIDLEADFSKIQKRIAEPAKVVKMPRRNLWLRVAAAVVLLMAAMPFLWEYFSEPEIPMQTVATTDAVSEQVILPDGTRVWLNKNTEFAYYTSPNPKIRKVKLKGEAFFDVRENPESPFVVETSAGKVTVLGTSFTVRNVESENNFAVHVASGRVEMAPESMSEKVILTKNESGIFLKKEKQLQKKTNPHLNEMAWHTGQVGFDGTPLSEALISLGNIYEAEIVLENPALTDCPLTATFQMKGIHSVKIILETMLGAEFVETGEGKYAIRGGRCE